MPLKDALAHLHSVLEGLPSFHLETYVGSRPPQDQGASLRSAVDRARAQGQLILLAESRLLLDGSQPDEGVDSLELEGIHHALVGLLLRFYYFFRRKHLAPSHQMP